MFLSTVDFLSIDVYMQCIDFGSNSKRKKLQCRLIMDYLIEKHSQ